MKNRSEWISDFQRRVAPYRPIDLLESERKRKRLSEINSPVLIPSPRQDPETAPIATAWAVPSAGERRRRKRHSKNRRNRDRLGIRTNNEVVQTPTIRPLLPRFKIEEAVTYINDLVENCEGRGTITAVIQPGIEDYSPNDGLYRYEIDTIYVTNQGASGWVLEDELTLMRGETVTKSDTKT